MPTWLMFCESMVFVGASPELVNATPHHCSGSARRLTPRTMADDRDYLFPSMSTNLDGEQMRAKLDETYAKEAWADVETERSPAAPKESDLVLPPTKRAKEESGPPVKLPPQGWWTEAPTKTPPPTKPAACKPPPPKLAMAKGREVMNRNTCCRIG